MFAVTTTPIFTRPPAQILIASLRLERRRTAEVQDLYSRPIPASARLEARRAA